MRFNQVIESNQEYVLWINRWRDLLKKVNPETCQTPSFAMILRSYPTKRTFFLQRLFLLFSYCFTPMCVCVCVFMKHHDIDSWALFAIGWVAYEGVLDTVIPFSSHLKWCRSTRFTRLRNFGLTVVQWEEAVDRDDVTNSSISRFYRTSAVKFIE